MQHQYAVMADTAIYLVIVLLYGTHLRALQTTPASLVNNINTTITTYYIVSKLFMCFNVFFLLCMHVHMYVYQ
jgi:hypothetical protein